jgi:hypothetical protein
MPKQKQYGLNKTEPQLRKEFWDAPLEALLDRRTIAAGIMRSKGWMELRALKGGGVPYLKCGRRCMYRKEDALKWLEENSQQVDSTRDYHSSIKVS